METNPPMQIPRTPLVIALGCLAAAAGIGIAALNRGAGFYEWHPIYLWVTAPYALFAIALIIPWGVARNRVVSGSVTAIGLLFFTYFFYVNAMWRPANSTAPLIVFDAPVYLVLGGAACWWLAYRVVRKRN